MRDFNFFDPYLKTQTKPNTNRIIIIVLAALLLALMVYYQFMLINKANELQANIDEIQTYIQSSDTSIKLAIVDQKQKELERLQGIYTSVGVITAQIELSDNLDDMLIEQINAQLPENAFLSELSINSNLITIRGYSTEYPIVAQFAYNLRESGGLNNILIPSVNENNGIFEFTINATVGMEVSDAN
ncbi:PilN domain-containing protein [Fusibacter bizertensis]